MSGRILATGGRTLGTVFDDSCSLSGACTGFDRILREAWEAGKLLCGALVSDFKSDTSWFEASVTGSFGRELEGMVGARFLSR